MQNLVPGNTPQNNFSSREFSMLCTMRCAGCRSNIARLCQQLALHLVFSFNAVANHKQMRKLVHDIVESDSLLTQYIFLLLHVDRIINLWSAYTRARFFFFATTASALHRLNYHESLHRRCHRLRHYSRP